MIPAVSNAIIPFSAIPAGIGMNGKNIMNNCISGLATQQEDSIPSIAPDFKWNSV